MSIRCVLAPPGIVIFAPPTTQRNASGGKGKAAPGRGGPEMRGQGHYRGRDSVEPRPGQSGCCSPRCLILCAVVALMCSRARGGRSSITRWSSASVSRRSTHSSAYCASLASPISSICRSLSSIALFWLGAGTLRRIPRPGLYALRPSFAPRSGGREDCYRELRRIPLLRGSLNKGKRKDQGCQTRLVAGCLLTA